MKKFKRILAVVLTLAMTFPMVTVSKTEIKAANTPVALTNWSFFQAGQYDFNATEEGNEGYIGSVIMNDTNEVIDGWLRGSGVTGNYEDPSSNQTQTASQTSTGFMIDIVNTGWDKDWNNDTINPWSIQAKMNDVSMKAGHTYTVSFKAKATEKKYARVAFECEYYTTPYAEDAPVGDNQIIALGTTEKTYTYTFTNWVSATKFSAILMLGAFGAQYDYDGTDISDIVTEIELCWNGTVYVSDFSITDKGLHPDYIAAPEPEKPTTAGPVETTSSTGEKVEAAEGENVAANKSWQSFSVCTREDGGVWEDALKEVDVIDPITGEWLRKQTYLQDYATEGYIAAGATASNFDFYVKNSGWDGEYNENCELVGDKPWGMTATMTEIPVDNGRTYTISFDIKSTLKGSKVLTDVNGNAVKDENGKDVTEPVTSKHILFKAYDPISRGEPSVEIISATNASTGGYITLDSSKDTWTTVTATIKIPDKEIFPSDQMGVKFALGAFLKSYPDEINMSGYVYVKDFKIIAGEKPYNIRFVTGDTVISEQAVMYGEKIEYVDYYREGYILTGYKNRETGALYDFNTTVTKDLILEAVWEPIKCQVVFKDGNTVITKQTVNHGTAATPPDLKKEGYTLSWDKSFNYVTGNLEVNAIWTANKYNVVFKDGALILKVQEVYHGYAAIAPEVAKSGYILSWDKSFDVIKGNMTINAVWTPKNAGSTVNGNNKTEPTTTKVNKPGKNSVAQKQTSVNVAKAKINKATKAKKSKKIKISLKKIKGASGYQIQLSKNKKFKTVLIKRNVKKVSFYISSKQLKKLNKIYVKARAFIKKNGKTYYGDWSKAKKVKIK